jgi:hypothetical protein
MGAEPHAPKRAGAREGRPRHAPFPRASRLPPRHEGRAATRFDEAPPIRRRIRTSPRTPPAFPGSCSSGSSSPRVTESALPTVWTGPSETSSRPAVLSAARDLKPLSASQCRHRLVHFETRRYPSPSRRARWMDSTTGGEQTQRVGRLERAPHRSRWAFRLTGVGRSGAIEGVGHKRPRPAWAAPPPAPVDRTQPRHELPQAHSDAPWRKVDEARSKGA